LRKKPYKLRDGTDAIMGMKIWHYNSDHSPNICTGDVIGIHSYGELQCLMHQPMFDGDYCSPLMGNRYGSYSYTARRTCFSSLEAAEQAREKYRNSKFGRWAKERGQAV